eukprot:SAG31_NODE_360_length_17025_cov_5.362460_7_plen_101_part_00
MLKYNACTESPVCNISTGILYIPTIIVQVLICNHRYAGTNPDLIICPNPRAAHVSGAALFCTTKRLTAVADTVITAGPINGDTFSISALHLAIKVPYFSL